MKQKLHIVLYVLAVVMLCSCKQATEKKSAATTTTDDNSQFVTLTDVVPDAIMEIRYYSTYNFVGTRIDGYEEQTALLTKQAADSLRAVSDDVIKLGYRLKIYDAYRPQKGVDHFVRWAANIPDTLMKRYFYPDLDKSVLFEQEYIYEKSGHTRGSTVDLTLFDMKTEKEVEIWAVLSTGSDLRVIPTSAEIQRQANIQVIIASHPLDALLLPSSLPTV